MHVACALALLVLVPASAEAQKDPFVDAFIEFHSLLPGPYGDEGPKMAAALDRMAASLAAWDAANSKAAAGLASRSADPSTELALFYLDAGRPDDALSAIEGSIRNEPMRAGLHMLRGVVVEAMGRDADALRSFRTAFDLEPTNPVFAYVLAERAAAESDSDDLQRGLSALLAAYRPAGGGGTGRRAPFLSAALVDDRAADRPRFAPAAYGDGFALFMQGRYQDAIAQFRSALAGDPLVVDSAARSSSMARGIELLRRGEIAAAIEQLEAAVAALPSSPEAHRILGAAYRANREDARSLEHFATAVQLRPDDERARIALGRALADAGRIEEAERSLRDTVAALPASGEARWALADVYEEEDRWPEAVRELDAAARLSVVAGKGALYWRIAALSHEMQEYERVVAALAPRARLMPNEAGAHKDLALAWVRAGRQDEALVELITASLLGLEDAETLAVMGQIHLDAARYTLAEQVLRRAIALQPDSVQARHSLGRTLLRLGRAEEGKVHLAEYERLQAAAEEKQRRTFELELRQREEDLRTFGAKP